MYQVKATVTHSGRISSPNVYSLEVRQGNNLIKREYIAPADDASPNFFPAWEWAEKNLPEVPAEVPYPGKVVCAGEVGILPPEIVLWTIYVEGME